jgi:hypothetical protein
MRVAVCYGLGGNRVDTAGMERVAPGNALKTQPDSARHTIVFHGLVHVNGTGGMEPTNRGEHPPPQSGAHPVALY